MNVNPIVILDGVSAGYGQQVVLRELRLELNRGSFTALLGGNGSGKTTLLKTLAGILPPIAGRIQFPQSNGQTTVIGYVPQRESLDALFLLSGFEVTLMGTYGRVPPGRGVPQLERQCARQCLRMVGAEDFARQQFAQLSGGQKQRVLIARALATRPHFLLLDEPTAGIDVPAVQAILDVLSALHREQGLTVLLVTHDLAMVRQHADHILLLQHGTLMQGPVAEMTAPERLAQWVELSWG